MLIKVQIQPDNIPNYEILYDLLQEQGITVAQFINNAISDAVNSTRSSCTKPHSFHTDILIYELALRYLESNCKEKIEVAEEKVNEQGYRDRAMKEVLKSIQKEKKLAGSILEDYDYQAGLDLVRTILN